MQAARSHIEIDKGRVIVLQMDGERKERRGHRANGRIVARRPRFLICILDRIRPVRHDRLQPAVTLHRDRAEEQIAAEEESTGAVIVPFERQPDQPILVIRDQRYRIVLADRESVVLAQRRFGNEHLEDARRRRDAGLHTERFAPDHLQMEHIVRRIDHEISFIESLASRRIPGDLLRRELEPACPEGIGEHP